MIAMKGLLHQSRERRPAVQRELQGNCEELTVACISKEELSGFVDVLDESYGIIHG